MKSQQQQEMRGLENEICLLVTEKIIKYRSYAALPRTGLAMKRVREKRGECGTGSARAIKASSSSMAHTH